jgi:CheY-like chemotaxis protein/CheY-specific phosphatase CheX
MSKKLRKWILLAEDDTELVELYESFLEMHFGEDIKVIRADDGLEATNKLPFQAFDLILTDLNMPKKTGYAFIQAIKESSMNEHTPILVLTGEESVELDPQKHTILQKPIAQSKLISIIADQLKLGRTDQRVAAELLNAFIESGIYLLERSAGLEATQEMPKPKKEGQEPIGDFLELISLRVGKIKNDFLFSFDKDVINRLGQKSNLEDENDFRKIVSVAGDVIVKYSIKKFQGQNFQILNEMPLSKSSSEYKKIIRSKGLMIPVRTPLGMMHIYGLMQ